MPAALSPVFIRPVVGEPRIDQATAPTSGGRKSGVSPAVSTSFLNGVFVRATIQAKRSPITSDTKVEQRPITSELLSAVRIVGSARTSTKFESEAEPSWSPSVAGLPM